MYIVPLSMLYLWDDIWGRMRFGHTGLKSTLKVKGRHERGRCKDGGEETLELVLVHRPLSRCQRNKMTAFLKETKLHLQVLLGMNVGDIRCRAVFVFLEETELKWRI